MIQSRTEDKIAYMLPQVDVVVLTRSDAPLRGEVKRGLQSQRGVRVAPHRVVGSPLPQDRCRWDSIARARNKGKSLGTAPWLMFVDDDVVLAPGCISALVAELNRRPAYGALAADYLGERRARQSAGHVAMGATLFRREALDQIHFTWRGKKCECQCCCDDLRRLHWAIDYCPSAEARHLSKAEISKSYSNAATAHETARDSGAARRGEMPLARLPSVCLVAVYFGPPPGWINLFLLSCAYNPSIDFLLFTDQKDFPATPTNVRVKRLSKSSFNALATDKLGLEVRPSGAYKLCDFKPTYGHLFEDFLVGWDYWGYIDLDVIYGDIRRFLSLARLQEYDVFTARKEYLVGHFTLFRNTRRMARLYEQSADYRSTLQSRGMLSFSECGGQWGRRFQGKPLTSSASCDSMTHVVHRLMAKDKISACFSPVVFERFELTAPGWRLRWRAGRLWRVDKPGEAMYFHFRAYKQRRGYREPRCTGGEEAFEISVEGFERASRRSGA